MSRTIGRRREVLTSFIPQAFAKVGRVLKLQDETGLWVDGWVVERVDSEALDSDALPDYRKAIRKHRQATGDSQPRLEG